ncbi:TPA: hypothetical protein HA239_05420 [Candidatus Woesearchaeota archaeon]|nr:hypothetical protein [Candidatus Woesearchaeota archaeon]
MDSGYGPIGVIASGGVFKLQGIDAAFGNVPREHVTANDLINREKGIDLSIVNRLSYDTWTIVLYKGAEFSLDEYLLAQGLDGTAALDPIIKVLYMELEDKCENELQNSTFQLPDYVIGGMGARGRIRLDRESNKAIIEEDLEYDIHLFYLGDEGEDIETLKATVDMIYTPSFSVKEEPIGPSLAAFQEFFDSRPDAFQL